jgi:hypothetical protein
MIKNFEQHYVEWREKRIAKIEKIFGQDFFKNKTILEVGCVTVTSVNTSGNMVLFLSSRKAEKNICHT